MSRRLSIPGVAPGAALVLGMALAPPTLAPPAVAAPGNALLVLQPAPSAGNFGVDTYLQDPQGWPALAQEHPDGWSVAYHSRVPPEGWSRPFVIRGGGEASVGGSLHPRFAVALEEMLPARDSAILTLLSAPDTAACSPGKPNPHPFYRDGWLFLHDGVIGIEEITTEIWRIGGGADWEDFKLSHPRDYDGNADSTRGNAGEIYFLALLYQISSVPDDVERAFRRTVQMMTVLPSWESWQLNAILQAPECTWALRYAPAGADEYRLFYGLTTSGEYCIVDSLPGAAAGWQEIPNFSLAVFPSGEAVEILPIEFSSVPGGRGRDPGDGAGEAKRPSGGRGEAGAPAAVVQLEAATSPAIGALRLRYEIPASARGLLEIRDLEGRCLARRSVRGGSGTVHWPPPPGLASGVFLVCIRAGGRTGYEQILLLR